MSFADYKPNYMTIKDQSGEELGKVRALNDSDLSLLWQKHEEAMEVVFKNIFSDENTDGLNIGTAAMIAIRTAPDLITDVICLSEQTTDWGAAFEAVSLMPIGMRLSILSEVMNLTIYSEGGLEKLSGLLSMSRPQTDR